MTTPLAHQGEPAAAAGAAALEVDLLRCGLLGPLPAAALAGDGAPWAPLGILRGDALPPSAPRREGREPLAAALAAVNTSYGHPAAAELAARLADPATQVVVTGQQAGLFGGPLFSLVKAAAATLWAERLTAAGRPAVAVFWVATEDHDWLEVSRAAVPGPEGPVALDLGPDPQPLTPAGMRTIGPGVEAVLARLVELVPNAAAGELDALRRYYRPDARFGEAFSRWLVHLLGARCPLLLDAQLPALKSAERPYLERFVVERDAVAAALAAANARITANGLPLQVSTAPEAAPIFRLAGAERRRVEWVDGGYQLRGEGAVRPVADLLAAIADNPAIVSPGVLSRPVIADAILGTALQILGPGEMGYMAQLSGLYPLLGVHPPTLVLRPMALVLDSGANRALGELDLALGDVLVRGEELVREVAGASGEDFVAPVTARVLAELDALREPALGLDRSLERPWEKTRETVARALEAFAGKATAAAARHGETRVARAQRLVETVLPGGEPQERTIAVGALALRHGPRLAAALLQELSLRPGTLRGVVP